MNIKRVLILLFVCVSITTFGIIEKKKEKKILVIQSYHQGWIWTDNISKGIEQSFYGIDNIQFDYEYLDLKRNNDEKYMKKLIELFQMKSRLEKFDGIIVADNLALDFLIDNRKTLYPDIPIVFCGINNYNQDLLKNEHGITGIIESVDYKGTLDIMLKLHPTAKKILILNDITFTGQEIKKELTEILPLYEDQIEIEIFDRYTIDEIIKKLKNIDKDTLVYALLMNRTKDNEFISYEQGLKILEQSLNPVYCAWEFYFGKGTVGGKITSGIYQGRRAGEMLYKIFLGIDPDNIDVSFENTTEYMFDYEKIKKFNIDETLLPINSIIINYPKSFWENYFDLIVLGLLISIMFLTILVFIINFKLRKQREMNELNQQLEDKISQRTFELKEANKKIQFQQEKLVREAYNEGFSKVKSGIIHNIGNIVNPIHIAIQEEISYKEEDKDQEIRFFEEILYKELENGFEKNDKSLKILEVMPKILKTMEEKENEELKRLKYCYREIQHLKSIMNLQKNYLGTLGTEGYFDINEILEEVLKNREFSYKVNLQRNFNSLDKILCDKTQIFQVFDNIIKNQYEGLISSEEIYKSMLITTTSELNFIKIIIKDNGKLYSDELLKNIFNLSFITKEKNRKNFELYGGYQIIKKYGGNIEVSSENKTWNVFTIYIPK